MDSLKPADQIPPGFRFHPTEEELLQYYLKKKVAYEKIDLDVVRGIDLNKLEPWDIQERCRIGTSLQNEWYFFSHKDKKYPTGTRTNRATAAGFWKATGRDKVIYSSSSKRIGMRKTLVFYMGRAPRGQISNWILHEYRPIDNNSNNATKKEDWVICRLFKKKNHHLQQSNFCNPNKMITSSTNKTTHMLADSNSYEEPSSLDQIDLDQYETNMKLVAALEKPITSKSLLMINQLQACNSSSSPSSLTCCQLPMEAVQDITDSESSNISTTNLNPAEYYYHTEELLVDLLLDGQEAVQDASRQQACFNESLICTSTGSTLDKHDQSQLPQLQSANRSVLYHSSKDNGNDIDVWDFVPPCYMSSFSL